MARRKKSKKGKKNDGEEEELDRLSDLPDGILLHILSFLPEIRFCVRTSLLSKRWNNLWASLPDLIFHRRKSRNASSFKKLVRNVLKRRENLPVNKFTCNYCEKDKSFVATIINYAMSHNVQHFSLYLQLAISLTYLSPLFNITRSLKTLKLEGFDNMHLLGNFTVPSLTTLSLRWCRFGGNGEEGEPVSNSIDPFVGLFNLKSVRLHACKIDSVRSFKISGPQLASLTITSLHGSKVEIFAPKLGFFTTKWVHQVNFSHLDFPLLEIADIDVDLVLDAKEALLGLINMFRWLYNAHSLVLASRIIKVLMKCPDVLEDQSSPFVRLTTLKVRCYRSHLMSSFKIPDNVIKYFGENITVEKIEG